jgi:hypothetical protein
MIRPRPQRITPIAAPGTLLKRLSGSHTHLKLRAIAETGRDESYLALVRQCPCLHCGMDPAGEAAHLRMASGAHGKASGIGKKPDHRWSLPLCGAHHRLTDNAQHNIGERQFWHELGIDPFLTAERLWAQRGDLVAMRAVVFVAIAERG